MALFPIAGAAKSQAKKPAKARSMFKPSVATASQDVSKPEVSRDFQAEGDYRTLSDADDIRNDSARYSAAKGHATKQLTKARSLFGGRR